MFAMFDELVERRIEEARREGAFEDLPGAGRPLALDDDRLVPEDLRAAFRLLRNAGFVPPEVEALGGLDSLLDTAIEPAAADGHDRRVQRKTLALAIALERRGSSLTSGAGLEYRRALMRRMGSEAPDRSN